MPLRKPNPMRILPSSLVLAALAATALPAVAADPPAPRAVAPRLAALPAPIGGLVAVRPFRVAEPWTHEWRADRPAVRQGWIVVLDADPSLVRPRQTEQAVLMAGAMPLEVVHVSVDTGRVIAILPREPDGPGIDAIPFHLAASALPESITPADAEARRAAAIAAGLAPRPEAERMRAIVAGGDAIEVRDREALDREIGAMLRRLMPDAATRADELEGRIDPAPQPAPPA